MSTREFTPEELIRPEVIDKAEVALSPNEIVRRTADYCGIEPSLIKSQRRTKSVARARHCVWEALRALGWSYPEIGAFTGHHHTAVQAALKERA